MNKVIIALQNMNSNEAIKTAELFREHCWGFKVKGFLAQENIIKELKAFANVMVDCKLFDTQNDMNDELNNYISCGADIITVHCSSDYLPSITQSKHIAGVTVLTSFTNTQCKRIYSCDTKTQIFDLAQIGLFNKYKYIVCSAKDLEDKPLHKMLKHLAVVITPGIRPKCLLIENDDQFRFTTPEEAIRLGSDLLVIGRPIISAKYPLDVLKRVNDEIDSVNLN